MSTATMPAPIKAKARARVAHYYDVHEGDVARELGVQVR